MGKKRQLKNENQLSFLCKLIHKVTNPLICHLNDNTYNPVFDSCTYKNPSKTLIYSAFFEGLFA